MQLAHFKRLLESNSKSKLEFILPTGHSVEPHFHVTEVGKVEKSFIDCGGTIRTTKSCVIQIWVASDLEHRLSPAKLSRIIGLAEPVLGDEDYPVEFEYGAEAAARYTVDHSVSALGTLQFFLAGKQTECLAPDQCGVPSKDCASCC